MMLNLDEQTLIEQAQQGESKAFDRIINAYKDLVFRTSMGFLHNQDDADDVTQEVFVQMYRSIDEFRGDSKLSTWLYRIAVNKSLNVIRSRQSKSWLQSIEGFFTGDRPELALADNSYNTDELVENQDRTNALKQAIDSLPEKQRVAFVLSKYDDLSYNEISEVMQMSIPSVESLLHRAKTNLRKKLIHVYKQL